MSVKRSIATITAASLAVMHPNSLHMLNCFGGAAASYVSSHPNVIGSGNIDVPLAQLNVISSGDMDMAEAQCHQGLESQSLAFRAFVQHNTWTALHRKDLNRTELSHRIGELGNIKSL